jgi:bacillithiol biosynthesis cysteine-adding enzyme BshC
MFKKETISFSNSGVLNTLVKDYLSKSEKLNSYYDHFPDEKGYKEILHSKPYSDLDRNTLVNLLQAQAAGVKNTSELSLSSIQKLKQKNTYTVTTGHQLCLFTGPLYFIYKLITTINLAEKLKQKFPDFDFVPVYWMASEDHDFEEVNHFYNGEKKIQWQSDQTGAVGNFETVELKSLQSQISETFGISEAANYLNALFERAYLKHAHLADATRFLVNDLFGDKGLVIIDGNDTGFKQQFKEQFSEDLFENKGFETVNASIQALTEMGYHAQVNPRAINCFYIDKGLRNRIEKESEEFIVLGTDIRFTKKELETLIEEHPEKISPNVVLRPLYQQLILPNIAYVGGPGELAYWLEFKSFFKSSGVLFPILMPRNFVLVVDKLTEKKIKKLNFETEDLFHSQQTLITQLQIQKNAVFEMEKETESIRMVYEGLKEKVRTIDPTLIGSAAAEEKRMANGLARLSAKANRALRRSSETEIRQINEFKRSLFPNGVPQERQVNFSGFYLSYGKSFFELLLNELDPFLQEQYVFTEIE